MNDKIFNNIIIVLFSFFFINIYFELDYDFIVSILNSFFLGILIHINIFENEKNEIIYKILLFLVGLDFIMILISYIEFEKTRLTIAVIAGFLTMEFLRYLK